MVNRGGRLSTKKPEQPAGRKQVFEYNDRTYKSFIQQGLGDDIPKEHNDRHERRFIATVSDKYPITRKITTMVRQRILDADTHRLREVLTYMEDWEGFDFMGKEIPAVRSHWEGIWYEQNLEPITDNDSNMVTGYRSIAPTTRYYIDFKPKTVQELIEKSSTPDPELIKYIVQSIGGERTGYANYDQFVNLTWQQCADILLTTGGFESAHIREIVQHTK